MASDRTDTEVKLPRLRGARERQDAEIFPPMQETTDSVELSDYRLRRRKEFEDQIRRARCSIRVWMKYAQWEESQIDYARARSVWERAIGCHCMNHTLWLKYAEFEMRNEFVTSARSVWDRAVMLLPRVPKLWYRYIHMEEILGNISEARQLFERWMDWSPDQQGWLSFIKFELRYNETERARSIYERFVLCHPNVSAYILYAKFETKGGEVGRARNVYERATEKFADDEEAEMLSVAFAEFEEFCKEPERARSIYKLALDHIPKGRAEKMYRRFLAFEKRSGDEQSIEDAITGLRRFQYDDATRKNPLDYDSWFDYIRIEESVGNKDRIREIYERAIANVPPAEEKRCWQRYIYLWIKYALYEETETKDVERTRDVYRECLKRIPHSKFSFAKIWLLAAQFEIRQLNLTGARQILENAIGKAPKGKIFKKYIEIELQLGNIDRCRKLYERYLEWSPENYSAWSKYAELERSLAETERARAVFELAISHPALEWKEYLDFEISEGELVGTQVLDERFLDDKYYKLWREYLDFEISQKELEWARALYERLLDRTKNYEVWLSFAKFEASAAEGEDQEEEDAIERKNDCIRRAREIFDRAQIFYENIEYDLSGYEGYQDLEQAYFDDYKHSVRRERYKLLCDWLSMEKRIGDVGFVESRLGQCSSITIGPETEYTFLGDGSPVKVKIYQKRPTEPDCAICLRELSLKKNVLWLHCSHRFHSKCLRSWLTISQKCPICRTDFEIPF